MHYQPLAYWYDDDDDREVNARDETGRSEDK